MKFQKPTKRDTFLFVLFYFLNLFDTVATVIATRNGGIELNPPMRFLLERGIGYFVAFKVIGVLIMGLVALFYPVSKRVNVTLLFISGMYAMLTIYHLLMFWNFGVR